MSPVPASAVRVARALPGLLREVGDTGVAPVLVGGPPSAVAELARALSRDGDARLVRPAAVSGLDPDADCSALVHIVSGGFTPTDERALREADHRRLPVVCLVLRAQERRVLPYVAATDVVWSPSIDGATVRAVAGRLAARSGEAAWALGRGLPVLRRPVARTLVRRYAGLNAAVGAAVHVPGPDLPVLLLNQLRMVVRIAATYGVDDDATRRIAIASVAGAGLGLRTLARRSAPLLPLPGLVLRAGVAYAGTRAIGEAAIALLERAPRG